MREALSVAGWSAGIAAGLTAVACVAMFVAFTRSRARLTGKPAR